MSKENKDSLIISAYCVNKHGVLCYTGLPTEHNDLTYEHHNGEQYRDFYVRTGWQYEVGGVTQFALWHGRPFRKFPNG